MLKESSLVMSLGLGFSVHPFFAQQCIFAGHSGDVRSGRNARARGTGSTRHFDGHIALGRAGCQAHAGKLRLLEWFVSALLWARFG